MSRCLLIAREDGMPPIGTRGTIVGEFEGDLEVELDGYPCDAGPGTDWLCDPRWVVLIDEPPVGLVLTNCIYVEIGS